MNRDGSEKGQVRYLRVPAKAKRRRFTAECKLRVLEEADACREPG